MKGNTMEGKRIIESILTRIKAELDKSADFFELDPSPETFVKIGKMLVGAAADGVKTGVQQYAEKNDLALDTIPLDDGRVMRWKRKVDKKFMTIGGEVTISRNVYQADSGGETYVPLDHTMGTVGHYALPDVREAIAYIVAHTHPREVLDITKRIAMFKPSEKAIRNVLKKIGRWIESNEDDALTLVAKDELPMPKADVMVVGMDGVNVLLREKGKKAGRPTERPTVGDETDESKSCYKNAMVGTISFYTTKTVLTDNEEELVHERLAGIYAARMPEQRFPTFKSKLEREVSSAENRLPSNATKIVLMDGAKGLWGYVENNRLFEGYEMLLDFYHATEHLSRLAEALHGKDTDSAKIWYRRYRDKIKRSPDGVVSMLRSVDYYLKKQKLSKQRKKDARRECTFFENNCHKMDYSRFMDNGWPIGSGPTESGCKTIVKQRLCRSGMRWTRPGGQNVLSLRAIVKSDRWDALWKHYISQLPACAA